MITFNIDTRTGPSFYFILFYFFLLINYNNNIDHIRLYTKKSFNITSVVYKDEYILCTKRDLKE